MTYAPQNILLAAFLHLSCQQEFVQNKVCLLEIENDIKLADVSVVLVHLFDVSVDGLEGDQLVVGRGATGDEKEGGITAVDDFGICTRNNSAVKGIFKSESKCWP